MKEYIIDRHPGCLHNWVACGKRTNDYLSVSKHYLMIKVQENKEKFKIIGKNFFLGLTLKMRKTSIITNQITFKDLCFTRGIFIEEIHS